MSAPALPTLLPLTTERMILRPLDASDARTHRDYFEKSLDIFRPWLPKFDDPIDWQALFQKDLKGSQDAHAAGTALKLYAFFESGEMVGQFAANNRSGGVFLNSYLGWAVHAHYHGQGLATEGIRALMQLCFTKSPEGLGLHRLQANIIPANHASRRVAEKLGFRHEGLAKRYLKINGQWQDHRMYAITREEMDLK